MLFFEQRKARKEPWDGYRQQPIFVHGKHGKRRKFVKLLFQHFAGAGSSVEAATLYKIFVLFRVFCG
jgi:hypothetical protein